MLLFRGIMAGTGIAILGMILNRNNAVQVDDFYDDPTITSRFFSDMEGNIWYNEGMIDWRGFRSKYSPLFSS